MVRRLFSAICIALIAGVHLSCAQDLRSLTVAYPDSLCTSCTEWNAPQDPFQIHGNTYFVGTRGLSVILITSAEGHILIDAALPNSVPSILENIRSLGFNPEDIQLILNSHSHFDHAGGIAAIQHVSGARVAASPESASVLESGSGGPEDPQYGLLLDIPAAKNVERFSPGDTLRIGPLQVVSHATAGHSPGGTSWSWRACEEASCLDIVYADSQTPVSADEFRFVDSETYPTALADFERGHRALEEMPCDVLITTHPGASSLWERLEGGSLVDSNACRRYAESARRQLEKRLSTERASAAEPVRRVAVSVDDLPATALLFEGETSADCDAELLRDLTGRLLQALEGIPATGFVTESRICDELRPRLLPELLQSWLEEGHDLANHTFSHRAFENSGREFFEADVIRGEETVTRVLGKRPTYFRYPFLHAPADSAEKVAFESFLSARGYRIAPVTLDNDEWIYSAAYARALDRGDADAAARIGEDYIRYMEDVFSFNEAFSRDLLGRELPQILLIHANHLNADYLDELREMILRRGYRFVPLEEAMADEAYSREDPYLGERGLSWLQRLAVGVEGKTRHEPAAPEWVKRLAEVIP